MSQFGVSILGVSLRHLDVAFLCVSRRFSAFLGVSLRHMDVAFLCVSLRFSACHVWRRDGRQRRRFVSIRRAYCDGDGNVDVSDAGSFQHVGVRLAMARATWTSATQVRFN